MTTPHEAYREYCRRRHRAIGLYLTALCSYARADGVSINRAVIGKVLTLDRVKGRRIEWFEEDVKEYFNEVHALYDANPPKLLSSIFVIRHRNVSFPQGSMIDKVRASKLKENGVHCLNISARTFGKEIQLNETWLIEQVAKLAAGISLAEHFDALKLDF